MNNKQTNNNNRSENGLKIHFFRNQNEISLFELPGAEKLCCLTANQIILGRENGKESSTTRRTTIRLILNSFILF